MIFDNIVLPTPSLAARESAGHHSDQLTKPQGSLGRLESLVLEMAAWQEDPLPKVKPAATLIFAADHGVADLGVSAYPKAVTRAMIHNFLAGGAAASVLSRAHGIPLTVVDVGVEGGAVQPESEQYKRYSVADQPSGDLVTTDAMDQPGLEQALEAGRASIQALSADTRVVVLGEMGIGNTTVASCLALALLGGTAGDWVGRGTGLDTRGTERKTEVVHQAVARLQGEADPMTVLRQVGGREVAALVGAMVEAARTRRVVLVDGFIVTAAALVATRLFPGVRPALLFGHRSAEAAHGRLLGALEAQPILEFEMRLGEASGALTALWILEAACRLHSEMSTFAAAQVPEQC